MEIKRKMEKDTILFVRPNTYALAFNYDYYIKAANSIVKHFIDIPSTAIYYKVGTTLDSWINMNLSSPYGLSKGISGIKEQANESYNSNLHKVIATGGIIPPALYIDKNGYSYFIAVNDGESEYVLPKYITDDDFIISQYSMNTPNLPFNKRHLMDDVKLTMKQHVNENFDNSIISYNSIITPFILNYNKQCKEAILPGALDMSPLMTLRIDDEKLLPDSDLYMNSTLDKEYGDTVHVYSNGTDTVLKYDKNKNKLYKSIYGYENDVDITYILDEFGDYNNIVNSDVNDDDIITSIGNTTSNTDTSFLYHLYKVNNIATSTIKIDNVDYIYISFGNNIYYRILPVEYKYGNKNYTSCKYIPLDNSSMKGILLKSLYFDKDTRKVYFVKYKNENSNIFLELHSMSVVGLQVDSNQSFISTVEATINLGNVDTFFNEINIDYNDLIKVENIINAIIHRFNNDLLIEFRVESCFNGAAQHKQFSYTLAIYKYSINTNNITTLRNYTKTPIYDDVITQAGFHHINKLYIPIGLFNNLMIIYGFAVKYINNISRCLPVILVDDILNNYRKLYILTNKNLDLEDTYYYIPSNPINIYNLNSLFDMYVLNKQIFLFTFMYNSNSQQPISDAIISPVNIYIEDKLYTNTDDIDIKFEEGETFTSTKLNILKGVIYTIYNGHPSKILGRNAILYNCIFCGDTVSSENINGVQVPSIYGLKIFRDSKNDTQLFSLVRLMDRNSNFIHKLCVHFPSSIQHIFGYINFSFSHNDFFNLIHVKDTYITNKDETLKVNPYVISIFKYKKISTENSTVSIPQSNIISDIININVTRVDSENIYSNTFNNIIGLRLRLFENNASYNVSPILYYNDSLLITYNYSSNSTNPKTTDILPLSFNISNIKTPNYIVFKNRQYKFNDLLHIIPLSKNEWIIYCSVFLNYTTLLYSDDNCKTFKKISFRTFSFNPLNNETRYSTYYQRLMSHSYISSILSIMRAYSRIHMMKYDKYLLIYFIYYSDIYNIEYSSYLMDIKTGKISIIHTSNYNKNSNTYIDGEIYDLDRTYTIACPTVIKNSIQCIVFDDDYVPIPSVNIYKTFFNPDDNSLNNIFYQNSIRFEDNNKSIFINQINNNGFELVLKRTNDDTVVFERLTINLVNSIILYDLQNDIYIKVDDIIKIKQIGNTVYFSTIYGIYFLDLESNNFPKKDYQSGSSICMVHGKLTNVPEKDNDDNFYIIDFLKYNTDWLFLSYNKTKTNAPVKKLTYISALQKNIIHTEPIVVANNYNNNLIKHESKIVEFPNFLYIVPILNNNVLGYKKFSYKYKSKSYYSMRTKVYKWQGVTVTPQIKATALMYKNRVMYNDKLNKYPEIVRFPIKVNKNAFMVLYNGIPLLENAIASDDPYEVELINPNVKLELSKLVYPLSVYHDNRIIKPSDFSLINFKEIDIKKELFLTYELATYIEKQGSEIVVRFSTPIYGHLILFNGVDHEYLIIDDYTIKYTTSRYGINDIIINKFENHSGAFNGRDNTSMNIVKIQLIMRNRV